MSSCNPVKGVSRRSNVLSGRMLDDRQRDVRKRFQDPLSCWLVSPLLLILWMQIGQSRLRGLQRPSQGKLRDREHTDPESQQGREALNWLVECNKQWCDMDPALEAVEEAFNAVCVAIAQHRILQRQPFVPRIGDKGFPAKTLTASSDGVFLAS